MDTLEREVYSLLARGRKIEAVKKVRELTGMGLQEAKDYVDSLARSGSQEMDIFKETGVSQETFEFKARELLARGRKIEAIKKVRELTGMSLKESKDFVDSLVTTEH